MAASSSPSSSSAAAAAADAMLQRAEQFLSEFDYANAVQTLEAAATARPDHAPTLDALSGALMEMGRVEEALPLLQRSAELAPEGNPTKWMLLAQLHGGKDSVQLYQRGLALMDAEARAIRAAPAAAASPEGQARLAQLAREASTGLCSVAELYTTELCDEPEAEGECERLLQLAVGTDARNPEAFFALVNLRLIQNRRDDAARYLQRCVELLDEAADGGQATADGLELTLNVARAAFELERFEEAVGVLEDALAQDSTVVDTYYLLAFSHHRLQHRATALEYLQQCRGVLQNAPDPDMSAAAEELLRDIQSSTYADQSSASA